LFFFFFFGPHKKVFFLGGGGGAWPNSTLERDSRKLNRYSGLERGRVGYGTMCLCKLEEEERERGLPAGSHWSIYLGKEVQSGNTKARDSPSELHPFVILCFPKSCSYSELRDVVTANTQFLTPHRVSVPPTVTAKSLRVLVVLRSISAPN